MSLLTRVAEKPHADLAWALATAARTLDSGERIDTHLLKAMEKVLSLHLIPARYELSGNPDEYPAWKEAAIDLALQVDRILTGYLREWPTRADIYGGHALSNAYQPVFSLLGDAQYDDGRLEEGRRWLAGAVDTAITQLRQQDKPDPAALLGVPALARHISTDLTAGLLVALYRTHPSLGKRPSMADETYVRTLAASVSARGTDRDIADLALELSMALSDSGGEPGPGASSAVAGLYILSRKAELPDEVLTRLNGMKTRDKKAERLAKEILSR